MTLPEIQTLLNEAPLVTATLEARGGGLGVRFSQDPPVEPGVYVVYLKAGGAAFYVGEAGNLRQRLTYLFRCYRNENPHPCHLRHQDVWEELPDVETFCGLYAVRWVSTQGSFGRLEAEEVLQAQFGTNRKAFYLNFQRDLDQPEASIPPPPLHGVCPNFCSPIVGCGDVCPVWRELTTEPAYQVPEGFEVPTLGGRGDNLWFRCEQAEGQTLVRVWRSSGRPNFTFDEAACRAICERFAEGLQQGRTFVAGGTSYFTDPHWPSPPSGRIRTPYAAAVIRHARQQVGLPI